MRRSAGLSLVLIVGLIGRADAQQDQTPASRAEQIEQQEDAKSRQLTAAEPGKAERVVMDISDRFLNTVALHTFWESAYSGGGFTLGAGYSKFVGAYTTLDVRGSITFSGYKRLEAELLAPRLFNRRGTLSVLGGWREATEVGFYGFGMSSSQADRVNYGFKQPYIGAKLDVFPTRRLFFLGGGLELSQWKQQPGSGEEPSVETVYTTSTLPGLGAQPVYWHSQGTIGFDSLAPSRGYARRGGFYAVTVHDYTDPDRANGFNQVDYEAIQHIPILRDAWVVSLHAFAETTYTKSGQQIPFFMTPSVGGGSSLRAYSSWRWRDLNSLQVQAEWRAIINRFVDLALFVDAGKVSARRTDLDLTGMKSDVGVGFRLHGQLATPLRIELAHGTEGFSLVFAASEVF